MKDLFLLLWVFPNPAKAKVNNSLKQQPELHRLMCDKRQALEWANYPVWRDRLIERFPKQNEELVAPTGHTSSTLQSVRVHYLYFSFPFTAKPSSHHSQCHWNGLPFILLIPSLPASHNTTCHLQVILDYEQEKSFRGLLWDSLWVPYYLW